MRRESRALTLSAIAAMALWGCGQSRDILTVTVLEVGEQRAAIDAQWAACTSRPPRDESEYWTCLAHSTPDDGRAAAAEYYETWRAWYRTVLECAESATCAELANDDCHDRSSPEFLAIPEFVPEGAADAADACGHLWPSPLPAP